LFSDDFDNGSSPLWGNESGNWQVINQAYNAQLPDNVPNAHSSLPFVLDDFEVSLDVNNVTDGGVWLRSAPAPGTSIGRTGVLLVARSGGFYWHVVTGGDSYGASLNPVGSAGGNVHLRITAQGNDYALYVNSALQPATTLTDTSFSQGQTALYSFSTAQSFDNVVVIPEPFMAVLLGVGSVVLMGRRRCGWPEG
jgi:hypothetical protein